MWTKENIDKQNNLGHLYDTLNQENLDNRMRKIKFSVYGRIEVLKEFREIGETKKWKLNLRNPKRPRKM